MTDTNNRDGTPWDALATRGARRGADAVLSAAIAAADLAGDDVPVAEMSPARPRRSRSRGRRAFGALGLAALLGVGGYAIAGVQGNGGGASSPDAAVRQLASAIDHEDSLAAVATLNPAEVDTLRSTVGQAEHKAAQTKIVKSSSAPFAGLDLSVNGLHTSVTTLATGIAKVTLGGSISAHLNAGQLGEALQRIAGNADGSLNLARLGVAGEAPFVVTVERDGNWYVSPAYTAFEDLREAQGLPAADFGSADASKLGASTPDGAVKELIDAAAASEWTTIASLVPPDQFPLYYYRNAFNVLMDRSVGPGEHFAVQHINATPHIDGSTATVDVTATGVWPSGDDGTAPQGEWKLGGGCLWTIGGNPLPDTGGLGALCLSDHGPLPIAIVASPEGVPDANVNQPLVVHAVEESGRWYVSPIGTALGYVDGWISNFNSSDAASLLLSPLLAPVTGSLTLDQHADVSVATANGFYLPEFVHYTLRVDAPTDVVVDTRFVGRNLPPGNGLFEGSVYGTQIYGAGGKPLTPDSTFTRYHLPAGTYDVVTTRSELPTTVTVWRAADAPNDVPKGQPGCGPTPNGGLECSSSGTTSETYTQQSDSATATRPTLPVKP